jgi:hypothetical protein
MNYLWVIYGQNSATEIPTAGCHNVDAFLKEVKKKLVFKYGDFPKGELSLSLNADGKDPLNSYDELPAPNTGKTPYFITVTNHALVS